MNSYKEVDQKGTVRWYRNGTNIYHREDGPAVEDTSGIKYWYINGKLHREDGPAVEYTNGPKAWYQNGKLHRTDGPAVQHFNGDKWWHYEGEEINCSSQEEFERLIKLKSFW